MKISVSICAYNAEQTISRTIESVLGQTYPNYEIVVINDGSTDGTLEILEKYQTDNPERIKIKTIPNGGLANARNHGLALCCGDLYINLDADDYLEKDTFEKAVDVLSQDPEIDVCFYGYKSFDENGKFFDYYSETKHYLEHPATGLEAFEMRLRRYIWICQGNAIYRLSLIRDHGRVIDLLAVFALLAGTATTFAVATPLMASIINALFGVELSRTGVTIVILVVTCLVYTTSLLRGFKGISFLANVCIYLFFGLLAYVFLLTGETRYILETGVESLGRMMQNFLELSTFSDPLRATNFPQNWTIYYWAYWMVWCVAAPFFIGSISKGRTIRQTILGGYGFGVGSTILSFIILGNYSMGKQMSGAADFITPYLETGDTYQMIVSMMDTMPMAPVVMAVVLITMMLFYATSFDSIALTASCYSYHRLGENEQPHKVIQLMWCILLILLPIALVFAESSMNNLQSVSIVAAFPIGAVIVLIAASFLKDAKKYLTERNMDNHCN